MKIEIPVALVTDAPSSIGQATAQRLAKAGYKVYGTSRRGGQEGRGSFEMLRLDVTNDESVEAAVTAVLRLRGRIDVLVNNAGFGVAPGGTEESSIEQARAIFDTSFFGLIRMTRAVLPQMRRQGSGRIINISSVLGFPPMPFAALYAASNRAVEGYSESLDHELRTKSIRVSVIRIKEATATAGQPGVVAKVVLEAAVVAQPKLQYMPGGLANRLRLLRRFSPTGL